MKWTENQINVLKTLASEQKTAQEISFIMKLSKKVVYNKCKLLNIKIPRTNLTWKVSYDQVLIDMNKQNKNMTEMANYLGCHVTNIAYHAKKLKIKIKNNQKATWSKEVINKLIELNNQTKPLEEISLILNMSLRAVEAKLKRLKIKRKFKIIEKWSNEMVELLIQMNNEYKSATEMAVVFNKSREAILGKLKNLSIKYNFTLCHRINKTKETEIIQLLKQNIPYSKIGQLTNVSEISVAKICKRHQEILKIRNSHNSSIRDTLSNPIEIFIYERWLRAKQNINRRNRILDFNITPEYLFQIYNTQNGLCYYSNIKMNFGKKDKHKLSIDRINSKLGYIEGNIALCCWEINSMKQDLDVDEFINFCKKITEKYKLTNDYPLKNQLESKLLTNQDKLPEIPTNLLIMPQSNLTKTTNKENTMLT